MVKNMVLALVAMMMFVGVAVQAEEEHAAKCACGDKCDHKGCACATCPASVKEAAAKSVEGIKLGCVHMVKGEKGSTFSFAATVGDKAYTVTVTVDADGKVTETKATANEVKKEGEKK